MKIYNLKNLTSLNMLRIINIENEKSSMSIKIQYMVHFECRKDIYDDNYYLLTYKRMARMEKYALFHISKESL